MEVLEELGLRLSTVDPGAYHRSMVQALQIHEKECVGMDPTRSQLALFVETRDQELIAGVLGFFHWNVLRINALWVERPFRRKGLGTFLMTQAEREALKRGMSVISLSAHEFEAPPFYSKLGYTISGFLPDYPIGTNYYYFFKAI